MAVSKKLLVSILIVTNTLSFLGFAQDSKESSSFSERIETKRISGTIEVPSYLKFKAGREITIDQGVNWIRTNLIKNALFDFNLVNISTDKLGHKHYKYQQTFNGIVIEGAIYNLHVKNGEIYAVNGDAFNSTNFPMVGAMSESDALEYAKKSFECESFKWEIEAEEERLRFETNNPNATYKPQGQLVFVAKNGNFYGKQFVLAYKFDIYAHRPQQRAWTFVNAQTGDIAFKNKRMYDADAIGTGNTAYSGNRTITTDSFTGGFRLQENGRGNGVNTYDMLNGTNYGNATDVTSATNTWNLTGNNQYALDAHWGAEMTYDYFLNNHNRNSIDDNGFELNSYVHYDNNYANAFWDGQRMTYGDGNGAITALTSLDIAGHEITHGLTTFTAGLIYQNESGALNESFSDIFGVSIEFFALGTTNGDWLIGEDIGSIIRSMDNPGSQGDPDTYGAGNWYTGTADNGGVHTNSGVQNFWYYLLTQGGSGTNDAGDIYSVTGLGLTSASEIAFRNLTVYLGPNSTYADARYYAIIAATDLFGPCTNEVIQTTNAWYAVNVGDEYSNTFETDFSPSLTGGCISPFLVDFTANSASAGTGTYSWDFGDGNTGTGQNPNHTYNTNGTYTVTLIEDGGACGVDTAIYVDLITAGELTPPTAIDASSCIPSTMTVAANGQGLMTWWDAPVGGNALTTGNSYTTPLINNTTSYWVESQTGIVPDSVGPKDNSLGNGGYFAGNQSLIFDAYQDFTLVSVWVDADGAGNRTIELRDNAGTLVQSTVVNVPNGQSRINLNFTVTAGNDYEITSPSPDLYRNSDGAVFPYTLSNVCSIKNTTASVAGYYYFFYDWEIMTAPCASARTEVIAAISDDPTTNNGQICGPGSATVSANGSGVGIIHWYDDALGTNEVGTGTTFTTPVIGSTTTYYASEEFLGPLNSVGPTDNTIGNGGYFTGDQYLIFDVASPAVLESVLVYANTAGNRTIELRNTAGAVLQDTSIFIPAGPQRVYINFDLVPGTDYELGTPLGSSPDLYRNNSGATFPYDLPGKVTITNSSAGVNFYYFFYDWEIREASCFSNLIPVDAVVDPQPDATINPTGAFCPSDAATNLTALSTGGTWTGTGITNGSMGTFDPAVAGNGTHQVIYTIPGTCAAADTVNISVNTALDATISAAGPFCTQDNAVTLVGADAGGVWSGSGITDPNAGTFDPATAGPGTYTITYTISGTCGDTDTETIIVDQQLDATIVPAGPYCTDATPINLTAANTGGTWSGTGITDPIAGTFDPTVASNGIHTITYTLSGACGDVQTETILVNPLPNANITGPTEICVYNPIVTLSVPSPGNGTFTGQGMSGATFDPTAAGVGIHTISYTVTNGNGCTNTDTHIIDVSECVGVEEYNQLVSIFPNPTDGAFTIQVQGNVLSNATIHILDATGKLVYTKLLPATRGIISFETDNLATGMYLVRLSSEDAIETHKVIVR